MLVFIHEKRNRPNMYWVELLRPIHRHCFCLLSVSPLVDKAFNQPRPKVGPDKSRIGAPQV
jgi:hypothetical protein